MPVTTTHAAYTTASTRWQRCRDAYDGGDAVKAAGETYLPRLDAQTPAEYAAYLMRADFYGATARTVDGLAGAVLRKPPAVEVPEVVVPDLDDVTSEGVPLEAFAKLLVEQDLCVGRVGILVDLPEQPQATARPYWIAYRAEQIVNWRTQVRKGRTVLVLVVLKETDCQQDPADPFVTKDVTQYRVLELVPTASGGDVYQVTLWTQAVGADGKPAKDFTAGTPVIPTRRGTALDFIPFVFLGPSGITADVEKPPLLDLVDMNLSHYRSSADMERAAFFTSSPTPYICGFNGAGVAPASANNPEGHAVARPVYRIGSSVAWTFTSPDTKVGMLEFTGQGLEPLDRRLQAKQELMAVLGARLLEGQKADAEAAATVRLRHAGDESVLKKITIAVDQALTQALRWHVWWRGIDAAETVKVSLNTDFLGVVISPDLVAKLLLAVQAGEMSSETFYYNLTRADLTRPGVTFKQEHEAIDVETADATPPALRAGAGLDATHDQPTDPQTGEPLAPNTPVDAPADAAA